MQGIKKTCRGDMSGKLIKRNRLKQRFLFTAQDIICQHSIQTNDSLHIYLSGYTEWLSSVMMDNENIGTRDYSEKLLATRAALILLLLLLLSLKMWV